MSKTTYGLSDIEFKSSQHVIDEIYNMNVKGGSPFGRAAAWAFLLAVKEGEYSGKLGLKKKLEQVAAAMIELKPTMATIYNTRTLVFGLVDEYPDNADVKTVGDAVITLCEKIIAHSYEAVQKLGEIGSNLIQNGETIMMNSYASSVMNVFGHAADAGKKFRVICPESRPLREAVNSANFLESKGIDVIFVTDGAMWENVRKADWCIAGSDTLSWDGRVANKIGTCQLSELAKLAGIPMYIASEVYKLDLRTRDGYRINLDFRGKDQDNMTYPTDFPTMNHIKVVNQFFDITPAKNLTGLITEFGVIPSETIGLYWDKLAAMLRQ